MVCHVYEEWKRNLLKNRPDLTREKLERTRQLMDKAAPDALVTGYEHLIPGLVLPDEADRHVLAAAIRSGASLIVTCNLADFPPEALSPFDIEAQHPDESSYISSILRLACDRSGSEPSNKSEKSVQIDRGISRFTGIARADANCLCASRIYVLNGLPPPGYR
jgi:hypothetical protein